MSLWIFSEPRNILIHLFGGILLCVGYFNFFFITEPVNIFFQISYLIGQLLVNKLLTLYNGVTEISELIYVFCQVLFEDSLIFIKDATEKFTFAVLLSKQCYLFLEKVIERVLEIVFNIFTIVLLLFEGACSFFKFLHSSFTTTIQGLYLLGSTIWRSIISLPETVVYIFYGVNEFVKKTGTEIVRGFFIVCNEAFECLVKAYSLLIDIPLDSVYGLIIGAALVILFCIKFRDICLVVSSAFLKLYQCAVSLTISLWTGRFLEKKTERNTEVYDPEQDERLCVICQYKFKEIIIFPCKHLCLCGDCSNQLAKNQQTCPICRAHIQGTLKVYF